MKHRRAVYPLTVLLSLATVLAIFAAGWVLASPAVADPGLPVSKETVRAFYAGINLTIRSGDTTGLESVVDEHVITHGSLAAIAPDRAGLARYLLSLHATNPNLELEVADIAATGSRAMVTVTLSGGNVSDFLGNAVVGSAQWGTIDAIRVDNHKVVELWSDASGLALLSPLGHAGVTFETETERNAALDRLSIPGKEVIVAPPRSEFRWLQIETGEVVIASHADHSTSLIPPQSNGTPGPEIESTKLQPGDLIGLPVRNRIELKNMGSETATALVLGISSLGPNTVGMDPAYPQGQPSTTGESDLPKWWTGSRPSRLEPAPSTSLASNVSLPFSLGAVSIDVGRAAFTSNASLSEFGQTAVSMLLVESGTLDVVSEGQIMVSTADVTSSGFAGRLKADSVGVLNPNAHASLHNPWDSPVFVTVFSIRPVDASTH
jgi:hypothetical protein